MLRLPYRTRCIHAKPLCDTDAMVFVLARQVKDLNGCSIHFLADNALVVYHYKKTVNIWIWSKLPFVYMDQTGPSSISLGS